MRVIQGGQRQQNLGEPFMSFRQHQRILRAALCSAAAFLASPAFAQSTPATADDDSAGDIVVTAQKRSQSLQDVSAAVSAVSGSTLANAGISNLADVQQLVPTITFGNDFNQAKVFIRGVGANTSTTGSSTGVALHVDGAYVARAEAQLTSLFDLERVEVLRGPQGSLYGRNAVGGSINLITRKPTAALTADVRLSYGDYNAISAEAGVGGPLASWLQFRVAGKSESRDGYGVDPFHGWDVDDLKRQMLRGQLRFVLGTRSDLTLSAEYYRQRDHSGAVHYSEPAFPGVARLTPLGVGGFATNPRDLASDEPPSVNTRTYAFTGTLNLAITDHLTFTNIANFRQFNTQLIQDLDASAIVNQLPAATTVQTRTINARQYSNEAQLNWDSRALKAVLGVYYFNERQRPRDQVGLSSTTGMASNITVLATRPTIRDGVFNPGGVNSVTLAEALAMCSFPAGVAPNRVCLKSDLGTRAFAVFGQANVDLGVVAGLHGVSLKLGGRYSDETVDSANPSIILTANANPAAASVLVTTTAATFRKKTFRDFTPELGLQWAPNRDLLFYYTYAEGFKAGSGENAAGSTTIVKPEKVRSHEIGAKMQLFDRLLTLNLAAYSYKLDDLQINKTVGGGPAGFTTIFENAAKTSAKGVEADVLLRPSETIRLSGAVSYTDSKYLDFVTLDPLNPVNVAQPGQPAYNAITNPSPTAFGAPCPTGSLNAFGPCQIQLAGNKTRNSPTWSYSLRGEVDVPVGTAGKVTISGDMYGKSNVYFTEFQRLKEGSAAYTMFDAGLRWTSENDGLTVQASIKNLSDVLRKSSTFGISTGRIIGATYLPPRTYTLSLSYKY
jgi:iron complex outermembrane recepter protein